MERQADLGSGDRQAMSWDSLIRFYRFVLRSGDTGLADVLTRVLVREPALRLRVDRELRTAVRSAGSAAPDWVVRATAACLTADSERW